MEKKRGRPTKRPDPDFLLGCYKIHGAKSIKSIASVFDVKESTVRSWISRLKKNGRQVIWQRITEPDLIFGQYVGLYQCDYLSHRTELCGQGCRTCSYVDTALRRLKLYEDLMHEGYILKLNKAGEIQAYQEEELSHE